MLKKLTLALTASLLLSAQATAQEKKQPPTAPLALSAAAGRVGLDRRLGRAN